MPPAVAPAVIAEGFGWTYARRDGPALSGLSFRLEPGRVLLVLGPSGSGKSTLARALAGLIPHVMPGRWEGSLRVGDLEVAATPARIMGERTGLVFQDPESQLVMLRVEDEVAFGLENRGWERPPMVDRVREALGWVGLTGFERRRTISLSGGEQQRLAIADILAPAPGLLVLDEPTANLDPPGMQETFERLASIAASRQRTVVLVEHRLEAALPLADDVLVVDAEGRQIAFGEAGSIAPSAVELLERSGAWVPTAWTGHERSSKTGERTQTLGVSSPPDGVADGGCRGPNVALSVVGVSVRYPSEAGLSGGPALLNVSLVLRRGERVALVGPNGAGKSTLLAVVAGLVKPETGQVTLLDTNGRRRDPRRLEPREVPDWLGFVFQDPELGFVGRTVRDEILASATPGARSGRGGALDSDEAPARPPRLALPPEVDVERVLGRFGLAGLGSIDPFRLSQGQKRRLSLAALTLRPPRVLLLDEPTFGLDRRGTRAVLELLDELRSEGQSQLLATHDPRLLPACERVIALDAGRIVFDGPPAVFFAEPPYPAPEAWRPLDSL